MPANQEVSMLSKKILSVLAAFVVFATMMTPNYLSALSEEQLISALSEEQLMEQAIADRCDANGCRPCEPKKPKCDVCKPKEPKCDVCKPKCNVCKPKEPKCDTCKPKCEKPCLPCEKPCELKEQNCEEKVCKPKPQKPKCCEKCTKQDGE